MEYLIKTKFNIGDNVLVSDKYKGIEERIYNKKEGEISYIQVHIKSEKIIRYGVKFKSYNGKDYCVDLVDEYLLTLT